MSTIAANTPVKNSNGFYIQAVASFAVSSIGLLIGILALPIDPWVRAFLAATALFMVSSTITISKVIRDREEAGVVFRRVDQARLEKLLTDFDPLRPVDYGFASNGSAALPVTPPANFRSQPAPGSSPAPRS